MATVSKVTFNGSDYDIKAKYDGSGNEIANTYLKSGHSPVTLKGKPKDVPAGSNTKWEYTFTSSTTASSDGEWTIDVPSDSTFSNELSKIMNWRLTGVNGVRTGSVNCCILYFHYGSKQATLRVKNTGSEIVQNLQPEMKLVFYRN